MRKKKGGEGVPPSPEKPKAGTYEIEDFRGEYWFKVPEYVVEEFAPLIGHQGLAVYCSLAWWVSFRAPHHRPSLAQIGERAGCSRATVWRVLKVLCQHQLIKMEGVIDETGRRPSRIGLTRPPSIPKDSDTVSGTPSAGALNGSARRAQRERAIIERRS